MSKKETEQLKGVALILLFWHHLFGCGNVLMLDENKWIPCFGINDSIYGEGSKICIGIFAAVSGYGLYKSYISIDQNGSWIKRIFTFLITYWTMMFCLAIPYLIYFNKFNPEWMLINLFALLHNDQMLYLSLSWYVKVYLEILLFLPIVKFLNSKIHILHIDILIYIIIPFSVGLYLPNTEAYFVDWTTNILSSIKLLFTWYPVFHIGVLFAKYGIPERYSGFVMKCIRNTKIRIINVIVIILLLLYTIYCRKLWVFGQYTDVICVAAFLILFDVCYKIGESRYISKLLSFLGKYSYQYWLVSGMFFLNTTEFQWILVLPKYSILILLWKIIIIAPIAFAMNKLSELICRLIWRTSKVV